MIDHKNQQGIALLMAILIVAMVAIISVHMITERQLQIYRTANLFFRDQANQYSLAVESWGLSVLYQDFKKQKKESKDTFTDSHQNLWNTALFDFEVDQVTLDGTIFDLQGRFNLNNLVKDGKVQSNWLNNYKRLLTTLDLPVSLAETLLDWLDTDEQPTGGFGAEDIYYIALEHPYRTANQKLNHLSELLLVKGYDKDVYNKLKSYVFVAPELTAVNINTTTDKVLQAMIPGLSAAHANSLLSQIETTPFSSVSVFVADPLIKDIKVQADQLGVSSNYFAVNSYVHIDKTKAAMQSIIKRSNSGSVRVLNRQGSILYEKIITENIVAQ